MSDRDPESIVRRMIDLTYRGGSVEEVYERTKEFLHPDVEYVNPPDALEPGIHRGHDGGRTMLASLREGLGAEAKFEVLELAVRGEKVFVRARIRTGMQRGMEFAGPKLGIVYTVVDGVIRRFEWRWDPEDARALFEEAS